MTDWKKSPEKLFWLLVGFHACAWILLPSLYALNQPLDVIEGYVWGREALIGTPKHPPMQAWILEAFARLTGRAHYASFLASQLCVIAGFWGVWRLGRLIASESQALLGVLLMEGIAYNNFTSTEFNPNSLLLAFWPLLALSFYKAVRGNGVGSWVVFACLAAGGCLSKYTTFLLLFCLGLSLLAHPDGRKVLRRKEPYLAFLLFLALLTPHFLWVRDHDFLPFHYAHERSGMATSLADHILYPLGFLAAQILAISGCLLLFLVGHKEKRQAQSHSTTSCHNDFSSRYLTIITYAPLALILTFSSLIGANPHDMWGSSCWSWFGLWLVMHDNQGEASLYSKRFFKIFCVVFCLFALGQFLSDQLVPSIRSVPKRIHFSGQQLASQTSEAWKNRFGTPLSYVVGDLWLSGNVSFYAPEIPAAQRPRAYISADPKQSPWIDEKDLRKKGGILVWCGKNCQSQSEADNMPAYFKQRFPKAEAQKSISLHANNLLFESNYVVGWAILPPED